MGRQRANSRDLSRERGAAMVEFAVLSLLWMPLLFGSTFFGYSMVRAIQVSQICRDAGHMYAYGVDFSQSQNQGMLSKMTKPVGVGAGTGQGALVFSHVQLITNADCKAANQGACANTGKYVFTSFFVFGNTLPQYAVTKMGNPPTSFMPGGQQIKIADYLNNPLLEATAMAGLLGQSAQQLATMTSTGVEQSAFISEMSLNAPIITWGGFSNSGDYARSIF